MSVESLAEQLSDQDPQTRAAAAERLCQQIEQAGAAAPALIDATADSDERVRQWASEALENLTPEPALAPILSRQLAKLAGDPAYWAATLLGRLGEEAAMAAGPLGDLLIRSDAGTAARQRAAWALARIGPSAAEARAPLEQAAASSDPRLATLARKALDEIG